jgi:hypothetical protein
MGLGLGDQEIDDNKKGNKDKKLQKKYEGKRRMSRKAK